MPLLVFEIIIVMLCMCYISLNTLHPKQNVPIQSKSICYPKYVNPHGYKNARWIMRVLAKEPEVVEHAVIYSMLWRTVVKYSIECSVLDLIIAQNI